MRIVYAILAEAAVALEGKFYIHGGEITRLSPPSVPWAQSLAIALKIDPEGEVAATQHDIETTVIGPDGNPVAPPARAHFFAAPPPARVEDGEAPSILIAYTAPITVGAYGAHRIDLRLDEQHVEMPFAVVAAG